MITFLFLALMSLVAGVLTGIVGMASLTLYPVLLSIGVVPITANATVTVAQVGAGVGTILSSIRELRGHWRQALSIAFVNTVGGILGAIILIHTSNRGFQRLVPVFILIAGILILLPAQKHVSDRARWRVRIDWFAVGLVGVYNGFFGAAAGLLMIAIFSRIVGGDYQTYNAVRNLASFFNNVAAALIFVAWIPIDWAAVPVMLLGLFAGGYLGPMIVRRIDSRFIRASVGVFAIGLAAWLAYTSY